MMTATKGRRISLLPNYTAAKVTDIDFGLLLSSGTRTCFIDLDHTLVHFRQYEIDADTARVLKAQPLELFIATNRSDSPNLDKLAAAIGAKGVVHGIGAIRKPRAAYYQRALQQAGANSKTSCMIGDRLFQDVWGANRAGLTTVLVAKLGPQTWYERLISFPEKLVYNYARAKNG